MYVSNVVRRSESTARKLTWTRVYETP